MTYLERYLSKKITDYSKIEIRKEITELIIHVLKYTNRYSEKMDIKFIVENLIIDLETYHKITLEEVKQAFRNAIRCEVIEISNTVLFNWISLYMNNSDRKNEISLYNLKSGIEKPKLTDQQIFELDKISILKDFNRLKSGEITYYKDFGGTTYDLLIKRGHKLIDYHNFIENAKQHIIEQEKKKQIKSVMQNREINNFVKEIQFESENGLIKSYAKSLSVNEYFENVETLEI